MSCPSSSISSIDAKCCFLLMVATWTQASCCRAILNRCVPPPMGKEIAPQIPTISAGPVWLVNKTGYLVASGASGNKLRFLLGVERL